MRCSHNDSLRKVRVTFVTKGEFPDLLERTLCNEFSSKCFLKFLKFALEPSESKAISDLYCISMFECHLQGRHLHISLGYHLDEC